MSVLEGKIAGFAASGTLFSLSKAELIHHIGYDLGAVPARLEGKEIVDSVGALSTTAKLTDIYRWGSWRILDTHEDLLSGYVSDKYKYGLRTRIGTPYESNRVVIEKFPTQTRGTGLIRGAIQGSKVKQNDPGLDWCIKVKIPAQQTALQGKTWGDWSYGGEGNGSITSLRPRRYPDTHIPKRREGS
nr:hypothetical protein [Paenibacillus xylanexedens]